MTKEEKIILSAYTGVLMCDFRDLHEYIEDLFGRSVWTHEMGEEWFEQELKSKSKDDFLRVINKEDK